MNLMIKSVCLYLVLMAQVGFSQTIDPASSDLNLMTLAMMDNSDRFNFFKCQSDSCVELPDLNPNNPLSAWFIAPSPTPDSCDRSVHIECGTLLNIDNHGITDRFIQFKDTHTQGLTWEILSLLLERMSSGKVKSNTQQLETHHLSHGTYYVVVRKFGKFVSLQNFRISN